jgi:uncharacterized protein YkwD
MAMLARVVPVILTPLLAAGLLTGRADERATPAKVTPSAEEKAVLDLTNAARAEKKLPPLKWDDTLTRVARAHSMNMARQGKLDHDLDGETFQDRIKASGVKSFAGGENIAAGGRLSPRAVVQLWMKSEGHRDNILSDKYDAIGIGLARSKTGVVYYTQVFIQGKAK